MKKGLLTKRQGRIDGEGTLLNKREGNGRRKINQGRGEVGVYLLRYLKIY